MGTLYWHDYETWGEVPNQDKPSQFAGVRTDEALNVVGEPLCIYCQPPEDSLPKPMACMVTGITPQKALAEGLPDYQFMAAIHRELSQPGTCGVGYNSIRFDDEVTRNGLFRNFYDPYEREWRNGNSRWDIIDMVRLTYALRPEGIEWPINEETGAPSFKLELLSAANGLAHESAHDALSDVYATIALAKLIKDKQPNLFDYAYRMRSKREVAKLIDLHSFKPLLHISSKYPATQGCAALVMPLAKHPVNQNGVIVFDLSADPQMLLDLSAEEIAKRLFTKREDLEEGAERVPLKVVHFNKSPMLVTPKMVDAKAEERLSIDKQQCDQHWQLLRQYDITKKLHDVFSMTEFAEPTDPEQRLYQDFLNDQDKATLNEVRQADAKTLANTTYSFYDKRMPELLFRYKARNFPSSLTEEEAKQWQDYCAEKFQSSDSDTAMTASEVLQQIDELLGDADCAEERKPVLEQLKAFVHERCEVLGVKLD
ncbi:exodeoxyribonuclease I [Aurantivibrio plasticivorans]